MEMEIEQIKEMLIKFKSIPKIKEKKPTYLEIAGFPHYENVISNIVSFFLDTKEVHGFGDLFIKSLLECVKSEKINEYKIETVSVEREVVTENKKRIDILIETNDEIICIENKIFANLYNDLNEYAKYVLANNKLKKEVINVILSLDKINSNLPTDGFENITYKELFEKINSNIGHFISYINSDYLKYLLDFKYTIYNLYGEEKMDKAIIDFFSTNWETILKFKDELNKLEKVIREKLEKIKQNVVLPETASNWISANRIVVHDIKLDEETILAIDYFTDLKESYFKIFIRKGNNTERLNIIKNILEQKIDKKYEVTLEPENKRIFINNDFFTFETDETKIAEFINELIDIVLTNRESILV